MSILIGMVRHVTLNFNSDDTAVLDFAFSSTAGDEHGAGDVPRNERKPRMREMIWISAAERELTRNEANRYSAVQIEFGGLFVKMFRAGLLVFLMVFSLIMFGCGGSHHEEVVAPIHLEMPTDDLQHEIGVSGFILGTFMMLNGYLVILISCVILLVKEGTFTKILDAIRMVGPMLNPNQQQQEKIGGYLNLLTNAETRVKVGYVGLLVGLVFAYIGAWIAL